MKSIHKNAAASIFLSLALSGCGGGGSDEQPSSNPQPDNSQQNTNAAPVAAVVGDDTGFAEQAVNLSATDSTDADGDALTYTWQFVETPDNSNVVFDSSSSEEVTFTPDLAGTYTVQLTVNDGTENSTPVEYAVVIEEALVAPVAAISTSSDTRQGVAIELNGASSTFDDRSGAELAYRWQFISRPETSTANIAVADNAVTEFTPDLAGDYAVELQVTDGVGEVSVTTFELTVAANEQPTAQAAVDRDYVLGSEAYAYSSVEDDDATHTYAWSFNSVPAGSALADASFDKQYLAFVPDVAGDYEVNLEVSDGFNSVAAESVSMTVVERSSIALRVGGSSSYFGKVNEPILIDFATSVSPSGSEISYSKSVLSGPSGSRPSLTTSIIDKAETEFQADRPGTYTVRIIATNEEGERVSKSVQIRLFAESENFSPDIIAEFPRYLTLGEALNVDVSASVDPEGDLLSYGWEVVSKPTFSEADVLDAQSAKTSVTSVSAPGLYVVRSTPTDNISSLISYGNFAVRVYDENPGLGLLSMDEQSASTGTTMALPAQVRGTMAEGDELVWDLMAAPYNSSSTLTEPSELNPEFVFDVEGKFVFQLRLLKQGEVYDVKHFVVRVGDNSKPVADAGEDIAAVSGEAVQLDGSASSDAEDTLSYEWSVVGAAGSLGTVPTFDDNTAEQPQLFLNNSYTGQLVVRLTVSDGVNEPVNDEVIIDITQAPAAARLNKIDLSTIVASEVALPYENTEVVEPLSTQAGENGIRILGMFQLHAENADITLSDIQAVDLNGNITPNLTVSEIDPSLPTGQLAELDTSADIIINPNNFVQIMVSSPAITNGDTALVELSFLIVETGETVSATFEYTN